MIYTTFHISKHRPRRLQLKHMPITRYPKYHGVYTDQDQTVFLVKYPRESLSHQIYKYTSGLEAALGYDRLARFENSNGCFKQLPLNFPGNCEHCHGPMMTAPRYCGHCEVRGPYCYHCAINYHSHDDT